MNQQISIPSEIAEIIDRKRDALMEERRLKEEADQRSREAAEIKWECNS